MPTGALGQGVIRLRYGWENMQYTNICPCGSKFDIHHSMSCKKGGFIYIRPLIRQIDLRDLTANMMPEVCKNTKIEPKLTPLS